MPRLLSLGLLAGFVLCTSLRLDSELPVVQHRQLQTLKSTCSVYSTANTTSKESVLTYVCLAVPTAGASDHFKVYLLHRDTSYLAFEQGVPYACENLDCDLDRAGTAYETPIRCLQLQRLGLLDRADAVANDTCAPGSNIDTDTNNSPATRDIKHDATGCMG
ncbi:hypothetical protein SPRG_13973 [Saprolegnia parasitica CBS 223.65]|uniref:Uncharacterized protein n=1 Tax=Saprolegnia parasitica (strain CBS 223.65) TaxID=695850 RepID=A0A067C023_SAPPC|nr:hypothetical protein SPRG_13973 [Saprolegnia parasitica CBS 223.65]KDO20147.1 hypothetical protein SPRG_13973 [Saprolegnia parasitica CBS 223.65]|eukprot:XP_012209141.1 hypothetical protein SPRG_13973 [Saprolegnia parasitica CBS 223.65]